MYVCMYVCMSSCIPAMIEAGQTPGDAPPSVASVQIGSASENTTVTGASASAGLGFWGVFWGVFGAFRGF